MNARLALLASCLISLCGNAWAKEYLPFTYSRGPVVIVRKQTDKPQTQILPWQQADNSAGLVFDTEIREAAGFYQQNGWFNLSAPAERQGVLLIFPAPSQTPIDRSANYAPLDILFIDAQGRILQIAPNIKLSELRETITPAAPVLAFLLLKGGSSQSYGIQPGDEVDYELFRKPPDVIGLPPKADTKPAAESPLPPSATPEQRTLQQLYDAAATPTAPR